MLRKYKYTFFSLTFAVLFIFGSMAAMNDIWKLSETKLFTEGGRVEVESPVRAWLEEDDGAMSTSDGSQQGDYVLTEEQMADAISYWHSRQGEIIHEPVAGQISMGEAIEGGKEWLVAMRFAETEQDDSFAYSVNAALSVGEKRDTPDRKLEPYYSFWTVQLTNQALEAQLLLNAVTGKVWEARITIYDNLLWRGKQEEAAAFGELAGLQMPEAGITEISVGETWAVYGEYGAPIYVRIDDYVFYASENIILNYGIERTQYKEYAVITYELILSS